MEHVHKDWMYRVDKQIQKQIRTMGKAELAIAAQEGSPPSMTDWRLHSNPFYFKFCETTRPEARDDSLIRGITLSIEHLREFLLLPESRGERDAQIIGYRNCRTSPGLSHP
jgi:hypothetical protein